MEEAVRSLVDWDTMSRLDPMRILAKRAEREMTTDATQAADPEFVVNEQWTPAQGWGTFAAPPTPLAQAGADLRSLAQPYLLDQFVEETLALLSAISASEIADDESVLSIVERIEYLLELGALGE